MKSIVYKNIEYLSVEEFCNVYQKNPEDVQACIDGNLTIDSLFGDQRERGHSVYYNGCYYDSFTKFCKEFGLRYPTALKQFNNEKMSPGEIIAKQTATNQKARSSAICEYQGSTFDSLSEAADILGFQASYFYSLRKKHNFSSNETIAYAMEHKSSPEKGKRTPCVISGTHFQSKGDALQAYGISRATVTSKMMRYGSSFEEAFMATVKSKTRLPQEPSLASGMEILSEATEEITNAYRLGLFNILKAKGYTPQYFPGTSIDKITFQDFFGIASESRDVSILFSNNTTEVYLEELDVCPQITLENYQKINRFNTEFMGSKFWLNEETGIVSANWNRKAGKGDAHDAAHTYRMIAAFLGACEEFVAE